MVVSPATLGDRAKIRQVRASLAKQGRIEASIALPAGMVPGSELAPFLWVIAGKPDKRKAHRTLAISAPTLEGDQPLQHDGLHQVAEVTRRWLNDAVPPSSPEWFAKLVSGDDLEARGYAPQVHLDTPPAQHRTRPASAGHLLTALHLRNFKSVSEATTLPLRPLTLLYGKNSAGKSSLIQALMLLRQSLLKGEFTAAGVVDLGSLTGILHRHDVSQPLDLGITFASNTAIDSDLMLPNPELPRTFQTRFVYPQTQDTGMPLTVTLGLGEDDFVFNYEDPLFTLPLPAFKRAVRVLEASLVAYQSGAPGVLPPAGGALEGVSEDLLPFLEHWL